MRDNNETLQWFNKIWKENKKWCYIFLHMKMQMDMLLGI
jgi:hypothetical protein